MNILALDLGTKCGFADNLKSGVWNLKPKTTESAGLRFVKFEICLTENVRPDVVVYEEVHSHMGVDAAHVYGGLQAVLQSWCIRRGIEYQGVGVATIKKFATGHHQAKKEAMVQAAIKAFPQVHILDDNHADALWLHAYAEKTLYPTHGFLGGL